MALAYLEQDVVQRFQEVERDGLWLRQIRRFLREVGVAELYTELLSQHEGHDFSVTKRRNQVPGPENTGRNRHLPHPCCAPAAPVCVDSRESVSS